MTRSDGSGSSSGSDSKSTAIPRPSSSRASPWASRRVPRSLGSFRRSRPPQHGHVPRPVATHHVVDGGVYIVGCKLGVENAVEQREGNVGDGPQLVDVAVHLGVCCGSRPYLEQLEEIGFDGVNQGWLPQVMQDLAHVQALCIELTMGLPRVPSDDKPPEQRRPCCRPVSPGGSPPVCGGRGDDRRDRATVRGTTFQESCMRTGLRPVDDLLKRLEADFTPVRLAVQERPTVVESNAAAGRAAQHVRQGRLVFARSGAWSRVAAEFRRQNVGIGGLRAGIGEERSCRLAGVLLEAATGVEPVIKVLQTSALPLGYAAPAKHWSRRPPAGEAGEPHPRKRKADDRASSSCPLPQVKESWSG